MPDILEFPSNIVVTLTAYLKEQEAYIGWSTVERPLRPADPAKTIGVFAYDWQPQDDSHEIGTHGPTLATYNVRLHLLVKHSNEVEARLMYSVAAKKLRTMLARDPALRVRLAALSEVEPFVTERVKRFGVRSQRYLNNEAPRGTFIYLATTDFFVQTETAPVP